MGITASVRRALYAGGYHLGCAAIKHEYSREGYFALAKVLARVMPYFVDNYRTGDVSLKIAAGVGINYELDARTSIALGADHASIARINFLRENTQHTQEQFHSALILLERSCWSLAAEIIGYPSMFRRSISHLRDFGIATPFSQKYHYIGKEAETILSSLTKLAPVIARCMELTNPKDFLFTFQEGFNGKHSLTTYSEFFWQLKDALENSTPEKRQIICQASRSLFSCFGLGAKPEHIQAMFAALSSAAVTVPETARDVWLHYVFELKSELFKDGGHAKDSPPLMPADVHHVTEDFNRIFKLTELVVRGTLYKITGFSFLDSRGKSDIVRAETLDETGKTKIFLIKRGDMSSDRLMMKLANVLGLHNYMVEKAQIPGEHQWWIIEYLPSENIAFSIRYPLRSTDWSIKCDLSEIFSSPRYINDLGQIFAFEYLFDVWDCKMKHILLDNDAKRLFRIDWEFIFGDTKYYGKSTTSDEGNMFLEEVSSRGGADMWIDKLQAAFLVSFKQARDQWGQLQAILIEAGISEEKIMKAAARLQRDPIQVLKERFPSIFTKSS